jgi:hypothetical protein
MYPHLLSGSAPVRGAGGAWSNRFLRQVLLSLRVLAGTEYGRILQDVGLDRYCRDLPPPTSERALSAGDGARLFQAGYRHLRPPVSVLFFTHMGEQMAQEVCEVPLVLALSGPLLRVPPAERVPAVWRGLMDLGLRQIPAGRSLLSDAQHHYLIIDECPYCCAISGAARPVCLATARFYEVMFQKLIDRSVVVHEVECAATGHGRCMFAVRRDRIN